MEEKLELLQVKTLDEMKAIIHHNFSKMRLKEDTIAIDHGLKRILSQNIISSMNVPHFNRSVVDGFAVKLSDIQGASQSIPGFLKIVGEVIMGKETQLELKQGETVYVPTGGMVPEGTEAMIMVEYTEKFGEEDIAIYVNAGVNENMMLIGDDIKKGESIFNRGHKLRAQDIGVLSALGYLEVKVYSFPKISIISTGDEIIKPGEIPKLGEIIDINTTALLGVTENFGGRVVSKTYVKDDEKAIRYAIKKELKISDIVVVSGGSSMGEKDYTVKVLESLGKVLLHGLAIKPGKPTILGLVDHKPVIGLPGQPVSAIMVYMVILKEFMSVFYGKDHFKYRTIQGKLLENIHAAPGRRTFQTVKILENNGLITVKPTYGKSGMITLLSYSDGYIEISENDEGKNEGDRVQVVLF
jgi:molybdopterin molybdotransferase